MAVVVVGPSLLLLVGISAPEVQLQLTLRPAFERDDHARRKSVRSNSRGSKPDTDTDI